MTDFTQLTGQAAASDPMLGTDQVASSDSILAAAFSTFRQVATQAMETNSCFHSQQVHWI